MYVWWSWCLLGAACSSDTPPRISYSYTVTPSGHVYRVFGAGPSMRGVGSTEGVQVSYLALSRSSERLELDADELMNAFGPELLLARQPTLTIRARQMLGKKYRPEVREVVYLRDKRTWVRKTSTEPAASAKAPDQPDESSFPFRREELDAASKVAASWLEAFDQQRTESVAAAMSSAFRKKLEAAPNFWQEVSNHRRAIGVAGEREELYRMQTSEASSPRGSALVQYLTRSLVLERVALELEGDRWRIAGYVFEPLPSD